MDNLLNPLERNMKAYLTFTLAADLTDLLTRLTLERPDDPFLWLARESLKKSPDNDKYGIVQLRDDTPMNTTRGTPLGTSRKPAAGGAGGSAAGDTGATERPDTSGSALEELSSLIPATVPLNDKIYGKAPPSDYA